MYFSLLYWEAIDDLHYLELIEEISQLESLEELNLDLEMFVYFFTYIRANTQI